ncbi:hypothetical protein [Bacillus sp. JJ722]|uniref:hypothetical protein n=1 Tax=Bacillus sp. JJ722 TaxID=3122973 RepID=UPI002FFDD915
MADEQWYSNKDLFEQINKLTLEMQETRNLIKQYNGLRERIDGIEDEVEEMKAVKKGKKTVADSILTWGGWIFTLITLVVLLFNTFNGGK